MRDIGTFTWKGILYDLYYDDEKNAADAIPVSARDEESLIRFSVPADDEKEAIKILKDKIREI